MDLNEYDKKGSEPYRVRTLEVFVENNGRWRLAQKESVRISR